MKRVLMLASVASMIDQFNMPNIALLQKLGYEVDVACNFIEGNTCSDERVAELKQKLQDMHVRCYQIDFARNIKHMGQNMRALRQVESLMKQNRYAFCHCHSPIGGVVARIAGHRTKTKVIYTAHGFHFYQGAPVMNWLVYYPVEKMLSRWTEAFEIQRQFTANAAHELRTPLALMQVQLDLYNSASHPGNDADTLQTIKMVTEQNDKLNRMVKTLLDMSELQTVGRDDKIILDAIVEEVLADLEPLAMEKNIKLIGKCEDATMIGSDILIYRLVYNLVENAIKYNHPLGQVTVTAYQRNKHVYLSVEDTGSGIPKELRERVFEPFFRVDKSRSRELGGVGLGLALVREIVRVHDGSICIKSGKTGGTIFEVTFAQHSM